MAGVMVVRMRAGRCGTRRHACVLMS